MTLSISSGDQVDKFVTVLFDFIFKLLKMFQNLIKCKIILIVIPITRLKVTATLMSNINVRSYGT